MPTTNPADCPDTFDVRQQSPASPPDEPTPKRLSARKRAANRANAARSTGPRTPEGKARAAMNAVRHGLSAQSPILPGENPAALDALADAFDRDLRPRGALERELVARVVAIAWRMRRLARAEGALWEDVEDDKRRNADINRHCRQLYGASMSLFAGPHAGQDDGPPPEAAGPEFIAGQFVRHGTSALERMAVYEQRLDRQMHAALREFHTLRKLRKDWQDADNEDAGAKPQAASADLPANRTAPAREDRETPGDGDGAGEPSREVGADETVQNEPTAPEGITGNVLQNEPTAPRESATADAPDCTSAHILQNEPTARPGRFSDPGSSTGETGT